MDYSKLIVNDIEDDQTVRAHFGFGADVLTRRSVVAILRYLAFLPPSTRELFQAEISLQALVNEALSHWRSEQNLRRLKLGPSHFFIQTLERCVANAGILIPDAGTFHITRDNSSLGRTLMTVKSIEDQVANLGVSERIAKTLADSLEGWLVTAHLICNERHASLKDLHPHREFQEFLNADTEVDLQGRVSTRQLNTIRDWILDWMRDNVSSSGGALEDPLTLMALPHPRSGAIEYPLFMSAEKWSHHPLNPQSK